ncbi:MAG: hypothetical protein MK207_13350 [Saprospiraceae bacterium]|nr:hypothetical protein [Saprospiraceae bacterium]
MGILDHQDKNVIRTTKLIYLEYLIFGIYFILFNLLVLLVFFSSEHNILALMVYFFYTILIPFVVVGGWRRKLIRYQDGEINGKELLSNFWSSRLILVAFVLFIGISFLKGMKYNDLAPISITLALTLLFTGLYILLHLVYAVITGLLIKKINESQKTE